MASRQIKSVSRFDAKFSYLTTSADHQLSNNPRPSSDAEECMFDIHRDS